MTGRLTRRAALGAFASIPATAALATPPKVFPDFGSMPAAPAEHPDAALFALEKEMEEAYAAKELALEACRQADRTYEKEKSERVELSPPPNPDEYYKFVPMSSEARAALEGMTMADMGAGRYPPAYEAWLREKKKWKAEAKVAWDAYEAERKELIRQSKADGLEEAFDARCGEHYDIGLQIFETPAYTLEGMLVKLRAADRLEVQSFSVDGCGAFESLAEDIKRLAGSA